MTKTSRTAKDIAAETKGQQAEVGPGSATRVPEIEIDRLGSMKVGELQALYAELTGKTTRSPNRTFLVRSVMEAAVPAKAVPATDAQAASSAGDPELASKVRADVAAGTSDEGQGQGEVQDAEAAAETETRADRSATPGAAPTADLAANEVRLSKLDIPALQRLYQEVIGRETRSTSRGYLVYKLQQARKGRVPVGPRESRRNEGDRVMVLPLRMEALLVKRIDEIWPRLGHASRMDLFRAALQGYFAGVGEEELALGFVSARPDCRPDAR